MGEKGVETNGVETMGLEKRRVGSKLIVQLVTRVTSSRFQLKHFAQFL